MAQQRKIIPGKFRWYDLVSKDAKKAQAFYGEVLGWKVQSFPMGGGQSYDMILTGDTPDTMIGGYSPARKERPAHWISYVSVENVDAASKAAATNGGKVVDPPSDIPNVGRWARIADPQGAEICVFQSFDGDPPDAPTAKQGQFFWNELHTTDPAAALAFYEKVVGFDHRATEMPGGGTYHIISKGGVDRAGATSQKAPGTAPHWLPYVYVDDVDRTLGRVKSLGGTIHVDATDIPGIGRFGVIQDPTGAALAVMKPAPRQM